MAKPDWTRDELILALDLYFREPTARGSKTHPEVIKLSNLLNKLPIHQGSDLEEDFRNSNGVGMKLSNFLRFDPDYPGEGLKRGSHLEEEVWNTFANDKDRLHKVALSIAAVVESGSLESTAVYVDDEDVEAEEGRVLTRLHRSRERNRLLTDKKKNQILVATGNLKCEVCGFDYEATYGLHGHGFVECHHVKPVSFLTPGEKTKVSDLALVCANCHRMIHRRRPWLSVDELRAKLQESA